VCQRAAGASGRAAIDKQLAGRVDFGVKAAAAAAAAAVAAAVRREEEEEEEVEEGLPGAAATLRRRWLVISIALQRALSLCYMQGPPPL
jgi:hypothetical protein